MASRTAAQRTASLRNLARGRSHVTAAWRAASLKNLAHARAAARGKPRTARQLAAARANLAHGRGKRTAARHAASLRNLAKARAAQKGRPKTARQLAAARANLAKARAARRGHHLSDAARQKIAAALRGKPHPHRGHPITAATRAKISAALKGRHGATAASGLHLAIHGTHGARTTVRRTVAGTRRAAFMHHRVSHRTMGLPRGHRRHAVPAHRPLRAHRNAKAIVSAHVRRSFKGYLRTRLRRHRSRIIIRRRVYAHRVWSRRR